MESGVAVVEQDVYSRRGVSENGLSYRSNDKTNTHTFVLAFNGDRLRYNG